MPEITILNIEKNVLYGFLLLNSRNIAKFCFLHRAPYDILLAKMNILFYCYPSAFQNPGGGEIQLLKTKEALIKNGLKVKLFNPWEDKLKDFDILHIFGSVKDCIGIMQTARNIGIKIALSPIFWSNFNRAVHENKNIFTKLNLCTRHLTKLFFPSFPSARRKTMQLSDILLPNSIAEKNQIRKLFNIPEEKMHIVPNGVDAGFKDAKKELFINKFGYNDFVLAVGRIEPRKNQLNLIKAFKEIDKLLVIIGSPVSDYTRYYELCKKNAGKNVCFLGNIPHEDPLLASAYAASDVFVAPGWFETPGLAALEAGLAGAKLAVTKSGSTREYFKDMSEYFDPASLKDMIKAINAAVKKGKDNRLQTHICRNYTWDKVAIATKDSYQKILG